MRESHTHKCTTCAYQHIGINDFNIINRLALSQRCDDSGRVDARAFARTSDELRRVRMICQYNRMEHQLTRDKHGTQ
jgi:hypothetical protein